MTIKERAKEYSLKDFDGYYTGREKVVEEGYIAGAKEQRKIDIESVRWIIDTIVPIFGDFLNADAIQDELTKNLMEE